MMVITPTDYSVLNNNERLLEEVKDNTGIDVLRVDIVKINKVKNEISVWVFFDGNNDEHRIAQKENVELPDETSDWESNYSNDY